MAPEPDADAAPSPPGADEGRRRELNRYAWIATGVVLIGTYTVVLDLTILSVALPVIGHELGGGAGVDWVVTTYLVTVGVVQPVTGWVADRFGKKRAYLGALALFTVGSLLAGFAPNLHTLLAARIVQGLGGGTMIPVGMAMMTELFPPARRGTALGVWGIAVMAAPALGPPVGGWLTEAVSWRAVFLINAPIGLTALALGWRLLRDIGFRERRPLHWPAWLYGAAGAVSIVVASRLSSSWGPTSAATLGTLAVGVLLLGAMVRSSLRNTHPLIDFRIFTVPTFTVSMTVVGLLRIVQYARLTFLPIELQTIRGMSAAEVGVLLIPSAVATASTMPLGGWLADRVGARLPVVTGLVTLGIGTWLLGSISTDTSLTHLVLLLVIMSLGNGLSLMPNTVAAMNSLPTRLVAQAAAVRSLLREVAAAVGTAALASVLVSRLGVVAPRVSGAAEAARAQAAFNHVFHLAALTLIGTTALALFLPGRRQMQAFQAARSEEHDQLAAESAS